MAARRTLAAVKVKFTQCEGQDGDVPGHVHAPDIEL